MYRQVKFAAGQLDFYSLVARGRVKKKEISTPLMWAQYSSFFWVKSHFEQCDWRFDLGNDCRFIPCCSMNQWYFFSSTDIAAFFLMLVELGKTNKMILIWSHSDKTWFFYDFFSDRDWMLFIDGMIHPITRIIPNYDRKFKTKCRFNR